MPRLFRKYHRILAIIISLPLFLTVISGVGYTIADEWFENKAFGDFLLGIHTMEIVHLEKIYPVLNSLGVVGLLITGLTMTGLFKQKNPPKEIS